jgi:hypothetical protein
MSGEISDGMETGATEDGYLPQYFPIRTEAEKPTNPSVGWRCSVASTGKDYTCFAENIWSLVSSPCYSEYSNHDGTIDNVMSLVLSGFGTGLSDQAVAGISLTSGLLGSSEYKSNDGIYPATQPFEFNCIVNRFVSGSGGSRKFFIGIIGTNCDIYFLQSNADSWACYSNDGTPKFTYINDVVNNDLLTIKNYGNIIMFYVNGVLVATHSDRDFGSNYGFYEVGVYANPTVAATVERSCLVNFIGWRAYR